MKIVHTNELPFTEALKRGQFESHRKELGGQKLGCGLWQLPPGKKSFPLHAHSVTEEALFVLTGTAKVRTPDGLQTISAGDYVSFPAGGPAHQLINDGTEPMTYLAMSVSQGFDWVDYPDSNKIGFSVGPKGVGKRVLFKADAGVDYFKDEPSADEP